MAFSPDGKTLASGGQDGAIKLWDPVRGQERATLKPGGFPATRLTFSPDGKTLAIARQFYSKVELWDVESGQERATLDGLVAPFPSLGFSPDGKTLFWGGSGWRWDVASGKKLPPGPALPSRGPVCFRPDCKALAGLESDQAGIKLWDVESGQVLATLEESQGYRPTAIAFSPDGKTLATGRQDNTIKLWDMNPAK